MSNLVPIIAVAVAYLALAGVSTSLAYAPTDAWTVWLASGLTLGLIVAQFHHRWMVPLAGAAIGAAVFALILPGSGVTDAAGYAAIEVIAAAAGAFAAMWLAAPPLRLESLRELGAFIVGAFAQAIVGAALGAAWNLVSGGQEGVRTFNVWAIAAFVGAVLVAPLAMTWSGFRPKRSGGLTMPQFAAGAVGCLLFLGSLYVLFSGDTQQRRRHGDAARCGAERRAKLRRTLLARRPRTDQTLLLPAGGAGLSRRAGARGRGLARPAAGPSPHMAHRPRHDARRRGRPALRVPRARVSLPALGDAS